MKRLFLICIILLSSCKKDIGILNFSLPYSADLTIPSNVGVNTPFFTAPTPDITTNTTQEFKNNGTDVSHVQEVKLSSLKLTIKSPSGKTLSFLKSIHLYLFSDNLPEVEIGYNDNVPNATSVDLTPTSADLSPYIKADKFKLRSKIVTDEAILQDYTLRADMNFKVKASAL